MPATHVAFLRGINVGRNKRVAMADLRGLLTKLGYRDVRTLLNSGNVVFDAAGQRGDHAQRIEQALVARLGVASRVTVLAVSELEQAARENELLDVAKDPTRLLVVILKDPAVRARLLPFAKRDWKPEALGLGTRVAYVWCPDGILESRLLEEVSRVHGDGGTARNWSTLTKLLALARAEDAPPAPAKTRKAPRVRPSASAPAPGRTSRRAPRSKGSRGA